MSTEDVEAYIRRHQLTALVQEAIKAAVEVRADDPAAVMARHLVNRSRGDSPPIVVFVLGGPGAGKGTQCAKIVEAFGYAHLSAGDLLRAERSSGSAKGEMISEYIKEGKIVPVEVTVQLLVDAIAKDGGKRFLVDGFPRNTNNLSGWQLAVGDTLKLGGVLSYEVAEDILEARLLTRGETSGRTDDNIESIKKRFVTFVRETVPVIEYYKHQGLVHAFDGARSVEDVWADTRAAIEQIERTHAART